MAALNGLCEQLNSAQSATLSVGPDSHYYLLSLTAGLFFFYKQTSLPVSFFAKNNRTKDELRKPSVSRKMRALIYYADKIQLCWKNTLNQLPSWTPPLWEEPSKKKCEFWSHLHNLWKQPLFSCHNSSNQSRTPGPPAFRGTHSLFPDDVIASGAKSLFGGVLTFRFFLLGPRKQLKPGLLP